LIPLVTALQPSSSSVAADADTLDRLATAFAWVIDAKSPYTYEHSEGVSQIAGAIGMRLGFSVPQLARLRRMALLHDIGKLAVPNRILDKPSSLTDDEMHRPRASALHVRNPEPRAHLRGARRGCRGAP
jgi:HD-GYP domain-containing protein (c-di-GMP phosphodiesterase class II)